MSSERITELVAILEAADHAYYNFDVPTLPDADYDRLRGELRALAPDHLYLQTLPGADSPADTNYKAIISQFVGMKSIRPLFELADTAHYQYLLDHETVEMAKADGQAFEALYHWGELVYGSSRGRNGKLGRNLLPQLQRTLPTPVPAWSTVEWVLVRGEGVIKFTDFEALRLKYPDLSNPRNAVSLLFKENFDPEDLQYLTCLAYKYYSESAPAYLSARLYELSQLGFSVIDCWNGEGEAFTSPLSYSKADFDYLTDGLVISVDNQTMFDELGGTSQYDEGQVALKYGNWASSVYSAKVAQIVFSHGKRRYTPMAMLEPVFTPTGKRVTYVSLHHVRNLLTHQVLPGTVIYFLYQSEIATRFLGSEHTYWEGMEAVLPGDEESEDEYDEFGEYSQAE